MEGEERAGCCHRSWARRTEGPASTKRSQRCDGDCLRACRALWVSAERQMRMKRRRIVEAAAAGEGASQATAAASCDWESEAAVVV